MELGWAQLWGRASWKQELEGCLKQILVHQLPKVKERIFFYIWTFNLFFPLFSSLFSFFFFSFFLFFSPFPLLFPFLFFLASLFLFFPDILFSFFAFFLPVAVTEVIWFWMCWGGEGLLISLLSAKSKLEIWNPFTNCQRMYSMWARQVPLQFLGPGVEVTPQPLKWLMPMMCATMSWTQVSHLCCFYSMWASCSPTVLPPASATATCLSLFVSSQSIWPPPV